MVGLGIERTGISFEYGGPRGKLVENRMLGTVKRDEAQAQTGGIEYQKYDDSVRFVKENQIGEPSDPKAWFANDLHATIAEELGLKDYSRLKFYTAVGSPLDKYHSIDAFFEFQVDQENNPEDIVRVTVDLTTNPEKTDYRADFIIVVPRDGFNRKDDNYKQELDKNAKNIAARFKPYVNRQAAAVA